MIRYCVRRTKYLKWKALGRNNSGKITVRSRQRSSHEKKSKLSYGIEYIYLNNLRRFLYFSRFLRLDVVYILNRTKGKLIYLGAKNEFIKNYCYCNTLSPLVSSHVVSVGNHDFLFPGNILPLCNIYVGGLVHNVEGMNSYKAIYAKTSKKSICIMAKGEKYVTIKLPSGKLRLLNKNVYGIFGELIFFNQLKRKKAGDSRRLGLRSKVRGVAMNACDHPHGGGEGKSSIGRKNIFSIWGKSCKGIRTRKLIKHSSKLVLN